MLSFCCSPISVAGASTELREWVAALLTSSGDVLGDNVTQMVGQIDSLITSLHGECLL